MYIRTTPNPSGAYPAPQSNPAPGLASISDAQAKQLLDYNGFVELTIEGDAVTAVTPNTGAWEAWKASLPPESEPEPTTEEQMRADIDYLAAMTGIAL